MRNYGNTLHFINRVDASNTGDWVVSPLDYYYDYFQQYHIQRHDSRYIDFRSIAPTDVVILGGGGMFDYSEASNRAINALLDTGAAVIAWSPGFNTHKGFSGAFQTQIQFERFAALTVRDYSNEFGIEYLPDVTCKLPELKEHYTIRRKYGLARHKDYPISAMPYEEITNDAPVEEIIRFLGESEVVLSNSFHMIYWAMLMGKKTVCINPFSTKFNSYRYPPEYWKPGEDLGEVVGRAKQYDVLEECVNANDRFFERVRTIIEARLNPVAQASERRDALTQVVLSYEKYRETRLRDGDPLVSQLYYDTGSGYSEERKLIAINNVYGDESHCVRFDLSGLEGLCGLRFDPVDGVACEVKICSARLNEQEVDLVPQVSVKNGDWDRFLTTDPQYLVEQAEAGLLEICFSLRILSVSEAEQTVYHNALRSRIQIETLRQEGLEKEQQIDALRRDELEKGHQIDALSREVQEKEKQYSEQEQRLKALNRELEEKSAQVEELSRLAREKEALMTEQREQMILLSNRVQELEGSQSWRLTAPLRFATSCLRKLRKG